MWSQTRSFALVLLLAFSSSAEAARGKLGISTDATSSGFVSPVLEKLTIGKVRPGSPAAAAGLKSGDNIVEINGRKIAGAPARELANVLKNLEVGQKVALRVTRGKELLNFSVVAAP